MKQWQLALAMFALGGLLLTPWVMMLDGTLLANLPMLFWLFVALVSICLLGGFALYLISMTIRASTGRYVDAPWCFAALVGTLITVWIALIFTDVWIGSDIRSISIVEAIMPRGNLLDGGLLGMTFVALFVLLVIACAGTAVYRHTKRWYDGIAHQGRTRTDAEHGALSPTGEHVHEDRTTSVSTETHRVDSE